VKTAGLFLIGLGSALGAAGASVEKLGYRLLKLNEQEPTPAQKAQRRRNGTKPASIRFPPTRGRTG
jgi:hypothetical protein